MRYGHKEVLSGVDFGLRTGEVVAMLGPNGAGKTTTIEILEGFRMRSAGPGDRARPGPGPGRGGVAGAHRGGAAVLAGPRQVAGAGAAAAPRRVLRAATGTPEIARPWDADELLDVVGLSAQAHARIGNLSGGQRRRLDVAIGIVGRPELLFLDEPTAGFDPAARREFHELVHRLTDLERATVLLTTHDLAEAEKLADRVIILAGGRIIADGSPDELALRLSGKAEVRWTRDGQRFVHPTDQATKFTSELFRQFGESVEDLEVRRPQPGGHVHGAGAGVRAVTAASTTAAPAPARARSDARLIAARLGLARGGIEIRQTLTYWPDLLQALFFSAVSVVALS